MNDSATTRARRDSHASGALRYLKDSSRSRGTDFSEVVALITGLMLLRLVEQQEKEREAVADFDGADFHSDFPDAARWHHIKLECTMPHHLVSYLRDRVWPALLSCRGANNHLQLIPAVVDLSDLPPDIVAVAAQLVSDWSSDEEASTQDLASPFEGMVAEMMASDPSAGQFSTPYLLQELMVQIAAPKPGETVYDPCFGMAGLLAAAARFMQSEAEGTPARGWEHFEPAVFGMEATPLYCLIGTVRLMLAGVAKPRVMCADALEQGGVRVDKPVFDCILADLPLGQRIDRQLASQYRFPTTSGDALFIQHVLTALKPGGRAVVLVPQSFLFRRGVERQIREWLLNEFRLDSVVSLPVGILKPYAGVACSLLVIHRQPPREDVLFVNDGHVAFIQGKGANSLRSRLLTLALRVRQGIAGKPEEVHLMLRRLLPVTDQTAAVLNEEGMDANHHQLGELILHLLEPTQVAMPPSWRNSFVPMQRLAERDWELLAKEAGLEKLDDFLRRIREMLPDTTVTPLEQCAEVFAGVAYTKMDTERAMLLPEERVPEVKLVRVQDLIKTHEESENVHSLWTASKKFLPVVGARIPQNKFLQETDVVVSIGGTVGKVALAGKGIDRTVASNGLAVIRCRDPLLGHFIACLLLTEPYQEWLDSHTTGSAIRHLRLSVLRELPIPLVPRAAQLAAVQSGRARHNPETFLNLLAQREGASPWLTFLLETPEIRTFNREADQELTAETSLPLLTRMLEAWRQLEEGTPKSARADAVWSWLKAWEKSTEELVKVLQMPRGLIRYTMLQTWLTRFQAGGSDHLKALEGIELERRYGPNGALMEAALATTRRVGTSFTKLVRVECQRMVQAVKVSATVTPSVVSAGRKNEITITMHNEGILPVASVGILVSLGGIPEDVGKLPMLSPQLPVSFSCKLPAQPPGVLPIQLVWSADSVDFSRARGAMNVAVEVQTLRESVKVRALEKSPYIVGSPLDAKSKMFYGRDDVIMQFKHALRTEGPSTVILLEGNRRVGKSSLLKRFVTAGLPSAWVPAYVNFQSFEGTAGKLGMATHEIFYGIAKELIVAAARVAPEFRLPGIEGVIPVEEGMGQTAFFIRNLRPMFATGNPFEGFRLMMEAVLEAIAPRRVLLMLDEFDKVQEGIDSGLTSPQLPENLRNLFHTYDRVSGILTGSRTIRRLRQEYWSVLFGLGIPIAVKGLDEAAARRLVTEPVKGQLVYAPAAVDYVVSRCARQPYLIQGLCHSIFELCAANEERSVTVELASKAADRYARDNEHFRTVWDYIKSNRRQYLVCLVDQLAEQKTPVTMELLRDTLEQRGVQYRAVKQLIADLEELVAFEILGTEGDQRQRTYRVEIPIFSDWLRRNVDSEAHRLEAQNELE